MISSKDELLAHKCINEATQYNMHSNMKVKFMENGVAFVASDKIISVAFFIYNEIITGTIANNKNFSIEKLIVDFVDEY